MDAGVGGEFGVERGCHRSSLADGYGVRAFGGDDFYTFSDMFNFGSADEDHFQRGVVWVTVQKFAFADGAVDLTSVGVAADADVEGTEAFLGGVLDFSGQQDCAGAGSESGFRVHEFLQLCEAFFTQQFQERARLAAGDDEAIDGIELFGLFDEHNLGAEFFEAAAVGVEIAL